MAQHALRTVSTINFLTPRVRRRAKVRTSSAPRCAWVPLSPAIVALGTAVAKPKASAVTPPAATWLNSVAGMIYRQTDGPPLAATGAQPADATPRTPSGAGLSLITHRTDQAHACATTCPRDGEVPKHHARAIGDRGLGAHRWLQA